MTQAHARGVKVLLGTLLPYKGSSLYDAADDAVRQGYNAWVRSQALADGVVDFDAALRDPGRPARHRAAVRVPGPPAPERRRLCRDGRRGRPREAALDAQRARRKIAP